MRLVGYTCDPRAEEHVVEFDDEGRVLRGCRGKRWNGVAYAEWPGRMSGEAVRILKTPDLEAVERDLEAKGYRSLAVVLVHSYTYPGHGRPSAA